MLKAQGIVTDVDTPQDKDDADNTVLEASQQAEPELEAAKYEAETTVDNQTTDDDRVQDTIKKYLKLGLEKEMSGTVDEDFRLCLREENGPSSS